MRGFYETGEVGPRKGRKVKDFQKKFAKPLDFFWISCYNNQAFRGTEHTTEYGRVPEWPMGTDCKSAA